MGAAAEFAAERRAPGIPIWNQSLCNHCIRLCCCRTPQAGRCGRGRCGEASAGPAAAAACWSASTAMAPATAAGCEAAVRAAAHAATPGAIFVRHAGSRGVVVGRTTFRVASILSAGSLKLRLLGLSQLLRAAGRVATERRAALRFTRASSLVVRRLCAIARLAIYRTVSCTELLASRCTAKPCFKRNNAGFTEEAQYRL